MEPVDVQCPPKDSIWTNHFDDEEKTTTVTIIEDFDQKGLETANIPASIPEPSAETMCSTVSNVQQAPPERKKKKAFRYGTKAERQSDRRKAKLKKYKERK